MIGTDEKRSSNAEINKLYIYISTTCAAFMYILPMYECVMKRAPVVP